uniref:Premelanosome protein b n=1 Tax=Scleropages formosus TaxID=113540 RepID=A0A8C9S493_SCLFO
MLQVYFLDLTFSTHFKRYQSWNSRMYPVWDDGDSRYKDCWTGGEVTFDIRNDSPTLTGAKITFNIDLRFPQNQTVLPDGQVVWAQNCTVNGTRYHQGQAVYAEHNGTHEWNGVFPDGTPFTKISERKPHYVFVWKAWGRYWQVADGPSSSLTIGTDNISLGSYAMEVFIPLGYAYTQFSITGRLHTSYLIPFTVSVSQMNDVNAADENFIQNRAIAFSISLHDPSQYLKDSDIIFNWDFGDNSGTLISRELSVTHTYISPGSFRPRVVLQASIPNPGCTTPADPPTPVNPSADPATSQPPVPPAGLSTAAPEIPLLCLCLLNPLQSATSKNAFPPEAAAAAGMATSVEAPIESAAAQVPVVVAKRQAPELPADGCIIYRYGSFSVDVNIIQGIESVEIVQVSNVMPMNEIQQNAVDLTVTCRGSLPNEVCTVVSDADCATPVQTACNAVMPSPECQLILRQFFNDSGVFCINVSMANNFSLAVTSARVSVTLGSSSTTAGTVVIVLGVMVLACAVGAVAFSYRRFKEYHPLREDSLGSPGRTPVSVLLWNFLSRHTAGESRPLLQGRVV